MQTAETRYIIFHASELGLIDFSQVMQTSAQTMRFSNDGQMTFVKWNQEEMPSCIGSLLTCQGPYSQQQMIEILKGEKWTRSHNNI